MNLNKFCRPKCILHSTKFFYQSLYYSSSRRLSIIDFDRGQYWERKSAKMERQERREQARREQRRTTKKPKEAGSVPLRGRPWDQEDVRISKTLSWLLRHGAKSEGLRMRQDGYVRVQDLLALPRMRTVDMSILERVVQNDAKNRYHMLVEPSAGSSENVWWIRANQGHSMKDVELQFAEIADATQVPMVVHGTNNAAWRIIQKEGLSPMERTHIHMAQTSDKAKGGTSGMRNTSTILIYIDLEKALKAGIKFYLSDNGVVLSKGDDSGYIRPQFFEKVTRPDGTPLSGWDGSESLTETKQIEPKGPQDIINEEKVSVEIAETTQTLETLNLKE